MSQPNTPLSHTGADLFLPSMDEEQQLSQADFNELFGSDGSAQPIFSSSNSDRLNELSFTYENGAFASVDSSNTSTTSTTDFSTYDFGQNAAAYPTPGPNTTHPYPLDLQRAFPTTTDDIDFNDRPRPLRSQTNHTYLHSEQPSQGYGGRRRSLSTSDTDRMAAANNITNPTFVRLQAPRARTATPEHKRRHGAHFQHGRSASQGPAPKRRPLNPTSIPYYVYNDTLVGDMFSTPIGTPLNEMMDHQDLKHGTSHNSVGMKDVAVRLDNPVIRRMTRPDELARSRQIIEIGALAVASHCTLDPRLGLHNPTTNRARVLKKLADIEEHLEDKEAREALSACKTIRDALSKRIEAEVVDIADEVAEDYLEAPNKVLAGPQCDMYDCHDDNEIMGLLMRENGIDCQETG
ncbi:hypothetical protein J4E91_003119 [Alternaria rosae]|nr:hypothetical protein J4E91_003119 [Alternaria rosae]